MGQGRSSNDRPGYRVGAYEIEDELGRGGMGVVYLGRHRETGARVAIKLLPSLFTDKQRKRFEREMRAAAALEHPSIVTIHSAGEWEGRPWYAMELVEGASLGEWVEAETPALEERLQVVIDVARGLHYAHEMGVVHRDIKPDNILVPADGGPARITDFGLAKSVGDSTLTRTGQTLGTAYYMSPEQAMGDAKRAGPKADQFSLGVVLYELLAGDLPFKAKTPAALFEKICRKPPPPLRSVRPDLPDGLGRIVEQCMAKRPRHRYGNCRDLAEDVERFLRGERPTARPSRRRLISTLFAVLLLAGAGIVASGLLEEETAVDGEEHRAASGEEPAGRPASPETPAEEGSESDKAENEATEAWAAPPRWRAYLLREPEERDVDRAIETLQEAVVSPQIQLEETIWSARVAMCRPETRVAKPMIHCLGPAGNRVVDIGGNLLLNGQKWHKFCLMWIQHEIARSLHRMARQNEATARLVRKRAKELLSFKIRGGAKSGGMELGFFIYLAGRLGMVEIAERAFEAGALDDEEIGAVLAIWVRRVDEDPDRAGPILKRVALLEERFPGYFHFQERMKRPNGNLNDVKRMLRVARGQIAWVTGQGKAPTVYPGAQTSPFCYFVALDHLRKKKRWSESDWDFVTATAVRRLDRMGHTFPAANVRTEAIILLADRMARPDAQTKRIRAILKRTRTTLRTEKEETGGPFRGILQRPLLAYIDTCLER